MNRNDIIANAVINNITVDGKFGSNSHNVCELFNLTLQTLDTMYTNLANLKEKLGGKSLLNRSKVSETNKVQAQMDLLETVVNIKQEQLAAAATARKEYNERVSKLVLLSKAKEAKEIQAIYNLSLEEIEKQIAELE